ncbi:type II toxin-antitoxin system CcdA family antitoxin [Leclercia adecarboxylata]|uniref:type II toxin-antitoxin system CcdA family antitoxin n=1 Tax=Leclercia adecarboxylata TaxID=83655 RepID=UPI002550CB07|nr:type II toxin-antitoxin system CcdA family antitoxin [Leclercia adecarboxylata]
MTHTEPKRAVTLTVDLALYDEVKQSGANISALFNKALLVEQKRLQAARWTEESREGLEEMRRFFETHALFSDEPGKL